MLFAFYRIAGIVRPMKLTQSPLGKRSVYCNLYAPDLLFPIPRQPKRDDMGISYPLPFYGYDLWNAFEISWLNKNGKPIAAMAELIIPADSPYLIESKSLKLY